MPLAHKALRTWRAGRGAFPSSAKYSHTHSTLPPALRELPLHNGPLFRGSLRAAVALGHETAQTGWHRAGDSVRADLPPPCCQALPVSRKVRWGWLRQTGLALINEVQEARGRFSGHLRRAEDGEPLGPFQLCRMVAGFPPRSPPGPDRDFVPRAHGAVSGDTFDCHNWGATGI